jgi:uncharacterized SAM-binding protein YcdF (DUF218 family)
MTHKIKLNRFRIILISLLIAVIALHVASNTILSGIGHFLIHDERPLQSDAIVVLNTGVEYYSRLIEAADLYNKGYAKKIIINGNRKMDIERDLEEMGYEPCCPWYENRLRVLSLYNVPREHIIHISAEDVYDSMGEAEIVGNHLKSMGFNKIIITTSKYHTKRARFIWKQLYHENFSILTVSAKTDPFDPNGWWRDGRQIRWVLTEYGARIYYYWKKIKER